jgi:hypothetical protein
LASTRAFYAPCCPQDTNQKNTSIGLGYNNQWVEIIFQICAYAGMQLHPSSIWPQLAAPLGCSASRVIFALIEHWEADRRPCHEYGQRWICQAPPGRDSPVIMKEDNA